MPKYCDVKPILHLLSDKDLLESVNVGAVLQALQHGLYNGEVAPVVHAHWIKDDNGQSYCSACMDENHRPMFFVPHHQWGYCPWCGAKMDEKEG